MWVSGYCQTVEYPWGIYLKSSIPLQQSAKGPPIRLNLDTLGMKMSWPKMMFECFPRTHIDALRPHILIYVSKTRILIS